MKNLFLLVFLLPLYCFSQSNTKGIVYYGQVVSSYFGNKSGKERLATLVFNKKESSYVSEKDSLDAIINNSPNNRENNTIYIGGLPVTQSGSQVYTSIVKDSVWSSFLRDGLQYVAEKKFAFKWELKNDTKKIGALSCKKAITNYRGRDYIAWYAEEIPVPFGPWKLQGLPGLILEAYDSTQEIYFYFKNIEYPTTNTTPINFILPPVDGKPIKWYDRKGYMKFCEDHLQKMYERMLILDKKFPDGNRSEKGTIEKTFIEITE